MHYTKRTRQHRLVTEQLKNNVNKTNTQATEIHITLSIEPNGAVHIKQRETNRFPALLQTVKKKVAQNTKDKTNNLSSQIPSWLKKEDHANTPKPTKKTVSAVPRWLTLKPEITQQQTKTQAAKPKSSVALLIKMPHTKTEATCVKSQDKKSQPTQAITQKSTQPKLLTTPATKAVASIVSDKAKKTVEKTAASVADKKTLLESIRCKVNNCIGLLSHKKKEK